jgi:hypothetical protein
MTDEEIALAFSFPEGIDAFDRNNHTRSGCMSAKSPFDETHDAERERIAQRSRSGTLAEEEDRVVGAPWAWRSATRLARRLSSALSGTDRRN